MSRFMQVYGDTYDPAITWTTEQWMEYAMKESGDYFDIKDNENVIIKFIKKVINFIIKIIKKAFDIIKKLFIRIKRFIMGTAKYEGHGKFRIAGLYCLSGNRRGLLHVYDDMLTVWNRCIYRISDGEATDQEAAEELETHYREEHYSKAVDIQAMNKPLDECSIIINTDNGDSFYAENLIDEYKRSAEVIENRCREITLKKNLSKTYNNPKYQIPKLCLAFQSCLSLHTSLIMKDVKTIESAMSHAKKDMENLELKPIDNWYYDATGAHQYYG